MRTAFVVISLVAAFSSGSCKKRSQSQLSHDADKPVIDSYGKQWLASADSEYLKLLDVSSPFSQVEAGQVLAPSDPLTIRVQHWMDVLDGMLRKDHAAELKDIPKPVARVIKATSPNAFVMDAKICLNFSLKFEHPNQGEEARKIVIDRNTTSIDEHYGSCYPSQMSPDEQKAYLEWWVKSFPDCSLTFAGNVATASAGCGKDLPGYVSGGQRIVVKQTSHFISFHTEIFRYLSETDMVSVMAHELAHYYRSHGTADGKLYNHFYRVDQHTTGTRPLADATLAELGQKVLKASRKKLPSADATDVTERAAIVSIMEEAIQKNLGQYTVEQEADDLSVEWLAKLGLPVDAAVRAQINLAEKYFNESPVHGWVTGTACRKAYEGGWFNQKGEPMMVPVAAWNDIHHSPCFRAFNMDREIKAHGYPRSGQEVQGPGPTWDTIVKSALSNGDQR